MIQESGLRHFDRDFEYDDLEIGDFINTFDGGVGMMQLTNPVPDYPNQHWSWHANVAEGLVCLNSKVTEAENWMSRQRAEALEDVGYRDYGPDSEPEVNENVIGAGEAKPVPTTTESGVTFGDAEDADHRPEDAVAIKHYNGSSRPGGGTGFYWKWIEEVRDEHQHIVAPGYWDLCNRSNIRLADGTYDNYVEDVCSHVP